MSPPLASGVYGGHVMHQRLRPLRHRLRYGLFMLLLDLDELPTLHQRLRWFSIGRFNLFSFRPQDHGDGTATDVPALRLQVERQLSQAGLPLGGAIRLLTLPRLLGYAFNPLSVWFCERPDGGLQAIVYEVNNTFGQRHSYLIEVAPGQRDAAVVTQRCDKQFFVSPFLGMDLHYRFRVAPPKGAVSLGVSVHGNADDAAVLNARFDGVRQPLTDRRLLTLLFTHPLLTLKVVAGIHWEALRLWFKGARLHRRPEPPPAAMTVVRPELPAASALPSSFPPAPPLQS